MTTEQMAALITEAQQREARVLSRIYGYHTGGGAIEVVEREAEVIRRVVVMLADIPYQTATKTLEQLVAEFRLEHVRTRSNRAFDIKMLAGLVRPIYAGLEQTIFGIDVHISNYPAIVQPDYFHRARAKLRKDKLT